MAAPVVIDMGIVEPPEVMIASMVEACQKAVGDGECHLVRDAPQGAYRAIAILTWDGPDKVRVEVGLRRDAGTEWRTRALSFQPEDVELERYRSVGFVVGTLATEEQPSGPAPPTAAPPPPVAPAPKVEKPSPPRAPRKETESRPSHSLGLVATLGGALDEGGPRYGGAVRGRWGLSPWLGVAASLGGSFRPRDENGLSLRFLDAGLGLGVVLRQPEPLGCELTLEAVLESFRAEAAAGGESDVGTRTLPAARAELAFPWAVAPALQVLAGGNLVVRPASTTVAVEGDAVGSTGIVELGLSAGARFAF
jgi:hypothetical protein